MDSTAVPAGCVLVFADGERREVTPAEAVAYVNEPRERHAVVVVGCHAREAFLRTPGMDVLEAVALAGTVRP